MKRRTLIEGTIYQTIADVGIVLIILASVLRHFSSEKVLSMVPLAIGAALVIGAFLTMVLKGVIRLIVGKFR